MLNIFRYTTKNQKKTKFGYFSACKWQGHHFVRTSTLMHFGWNLQEMKLDIVKVLATWEKNLSLNFKTSFIKYKKCHCQPYLKILPEPKFSRLGRVLRTIFEIRPSGESVSHHITYKLQKCAVVVLLTTPITSHQLKYGLVRSTLPSLKCKA